MVFGVMECIYILYVGRLLLDTCKTSSAKIAKPTREIRSRNPTTLNATSRALNPSPARRGSSVEPHPKCYSQVLRTCKRPLYAGDEIPADSRGRSGDRSEIHGHSDSMARNPINEPP